MTILAIAMTSLFEARSTAIRATGATEDTAHARLLAQAKLAETLGNWRGGSRASSGTDGPFSWRVAIGPETASWSELQPDSTWRLYKVNVTIGWAGKHLLELDTLKLGAIE